MDPAERSRDSELVADFHPERDLVADGTGDPVGEYKDAAELREHFIAVLGHDLRNPLWSIVAGSELLLSAGLPDAAHKTAARVRRSARRIELLADGLLDMTRVRLGGGLPLELAVVPDLEQALRHIVEEAASQQPERKIKRTVRRHRQHYCATAGASNKCCRICSATRSSTLLARSRSRLCCVITRPTSRSPCAAGDVHQGLGLGLYIVAEVAKAHGGRRALHRLMM